MLSHDVVAPHTGTRIETARHTVEQCDRLSPLTRGRGSKPHAGQCDRLSPLTRGRGSKPHAGLMTEISGGRPSHGDADRNTTSAPPARSRHPPRRPSHGDADRNTTVARLHRSPPLSPLTRGRGSKQHRTDDEIRDREVAPHTGTRIETRRRSGSHWRHDRRPSHGDADRNNVGGSGTFASASSPLTRGRGSKQRRLSADGNPAGSPLTRGRGSKHLDHINPA